MSNGSAMVMGLGSGDVILLDANGSVVASSDIASLGKPVSEDSIGQSLPIEVNDAAVGRLIVLNLQKGVLENEFITPSTKRFYGLQFLLQLSLYYWGRSYQNT